LYYILQSFRSLRKFFVRLQNLVFPSSILYFLSSLVAASPRCAFALNFDCIVPTFGFRGFGFRISS